MILGVVLYAPDKLICIIKLKNYILNFLTDTIHLKSRLVDFFEGKHLQITSDIIPHPGFEFIFIFINSYRNRFTGTAEGVNPGKPPGCYLKNVY